MKKIESFPRLMTIVSTEESVGAGTGEVNPAHDVNKVSNQPAEETEETEEENQEPESVGGEEDEKEEDTEPGKGDGSSPTVLSFAEPVQLWSPDNENVL